MKYQLFDEAGLQLNFSTWKVAGSLGGEDYLDRTRGDLNEGGVKFLTFSSSSPQN